MIYLNTKTIKNVLSTLDKIAPIQSVLKEIQSIRISANGTSLTTCATDLNTMAQHTFASRVGEAEFDVLINAKEFSQIIRSIKSSTIGLFVEGNTLTVHHHEGYIYYPVQSPGGFPNLPHEVPHHLGTISADLSMIADSIGDDSRPNICQVAIHQDGTIAATNGYILSIIKTNNFLQSDVFIDGSAIKKMASHMNGDISFGSAEGKCAIRFNNWVFYVPVATSKMAAYQSVIPDSYADSLQGVGVHKLIYHVSGASNVWGQWIALHITGNIEINAQSHHGIKWTSHVAAETNSGEISVAVDPQYLVSALRQIRKISATATLRFNGPTLPFSLSSKCGTYEAIIMPMNPEVMA